MRYASIALVIALLRFPLGAQQFIDTWMEIYPGSRVSSGSA